MSDADLRPSRPPIVLLHAAGQGPGMWQPQRDALADRYDVLTPALRDTEPGAGFSVPVAAERIAALIAERPEGRAAVCGISLGAFVALHLAADHPERVSALVLSGAQVHPSALALRVNHAVLHVLPRRIVVPDGGSRRALLDSYRTLFGWDARDRLARVQAPTLVLCGMRDRANLPAARALAAGIPGAELALIPGAGHLWNLSQPERFTEVLGSFLAAA